MGKENDDQRRGRAWKRMESNRWRKRERNGTKIVYERKLIKNNYQKERKKEERTEKNKRN